MKNESDNLKFLFVIDSLSTGGAQRQMVNLALGLKNRGYRIEIFCYTPGDLLATPLVNAGIPIHWQFKKSRFSFDVISALCRLINEGQFNLILSYLPTPNLYAIIAGRVFRRRPIPVVVSERRCDLPQGASLIERIVRQFYRLTSHVVTNSHHQRIDLSKKYPWLNNKLTTIYNGYDLEKFYPAENTPNNQPLQILSIAHVSPHKNGLCLVNALDMLRRYDLFPEVDWIGQMIMDSNDQEYLNEMKRAIKEYGLEKRWHWLSQRTDIVDQLCQHDVLVHPSFGEGLPNVVCEALACARPVIVSDLLDHRYLVEHGKNGFLFDHEDPSDLAEKIHMFSKLSLDERKKMGLQGRKFAEENLSLDRFTDDYEHLFLKFIN